MNNQLPLILLLLLFGSHPLAAESASFAYADFGPPSATRAILGPEWYQWDSHGDSDPKTKYDVKVIVFWDEPIKDIKSRYPVDARKKNDYRYLNYDLAKQHLKKLISEFEAAGLNTDGLRKTLQRIEKLKTPNHPVQLTPSPQAG